MGARSNSGDSSVNLQDSLMTTVSISDTAKGDGAAGQGLQDSLMTTVSISDTAKGDGAAGQGVSWPRDSALSAVLLANRHALSQELVGGIAGWEKYASQIKSGPD